MIVLPRDIEAMNRLAYSFAKKVGVCFEELSTDDFYRRLGYACAFRWGLVIELLIEALTRCQLAGRGAISTDDFVEAFAALYGLPTGLSPFTVDDYRETFDPDKLLELLNR